MASSTVFCVRYSLCDDASASTIYGPLADTPAEAVRLFEERAERNHLLLESCELVPLSVGAGMGWPFDGHGENPPLRSDDDLVDWDFVAMCDRIEAQHGSGGLNAYLDAMDD